MTKDVLKYLQPNAVIPIDMETTTALVNALKERLAQEKALQTLHNENERLGLYKDAYAEQEPVKYKCTVIDNQHSNGIPLEQWVKPPQRKPLTDEQIQKIWDVASGTLPGWSRHIAYARAIEAAHGIKENT
jgi:hypothetical protein